MGMYDPSNLRYTATKMMISALDEGDKVGFIRFSSGSKIVTEKMIKLDSKQSKTELLNMIQPVPPDGYTDFKAAFEDASLLLSKESLDAYKTVIVFLTDGRPEIPNFYYNYPNEAVSAAVALGIPVYAIGLTSYGQTAVLQRIAEETKGKLIPANSAKDLVDSFLQILGELKDRTIASGTPALTEKSVEFFLDPALTPYIGRISFVASRTPGMRLSLFDPTGTMVQEGTSSVSFMMTDDPNFIVFTIESPVSGIWRFSYEGSEKIEARAILRSRLRTQITSPIGAIQAGKPALIVDNIVEELADGSTRKVIGSAEFNAEITLPDGNKMSLDRFYDDGTHGDILAGDGNYSREFVETEQSGTYSVQLNGTKDLIPVFAFRTFATAFVPSLKLLEPTQESLDIRSEPIQIRIGFDTDQDISDKIEGKLQLEVREPDGKTLHENLELKGNEFFGIFLPNQDGLHTLNINSTELFVQGIRVDQTLTKILNIKRIPTLTVVESYFGYDVPL
ncbi:VWA domain-containing protein, partial [Methanospirillum sp.]|uniref:VWA domain-containing protein n=1 Tax=Methanospirillum sp. TaxID=45200 RepID=UPI001BD220C5